MGTTNSTAFTNWRNCRTKLSETGRDW